MTEFTIDDAEFKPVVGKVVVITGGSSGIGLATTRLLLEVGASVVSADQNPSPVDHSNHIFVQTDVTKWADLLALFKTAKDKHGRIDHVFSNAGITGRAEYLEEEFDSAGELKEPSQLTYDINLRGMINTSYLGLYHMRHQDPRGGSVVCTASASSFQRFSVTDYTTAKHGVLGWMRGIVPVIRSKSEPLRVNCVAPSWTLTGIVPQAVAEVLKGYTQPPVAVARSVALLMADESRQGQMIYSWEGKFLEMEEGVLLPAAEKVVGEVGDEERIIMLRALRPEIGRNSSGN